MASLSTVVTERERVRVRGTNVTGVIITRYGSYADVLLDKPAHALRLATCFNLADLEFLDKPEKPGTI